MQIADIMPRQIPGFGRKLFLQPLTDIHLTTDFAYDLPGLGDKKYVYIFSSIAFFLILIACINYINLSTAGLLKRSKEVGLRKIMGSSRFHIIKHFFRESTVIVTASFIIAFVLVEIFLPVYSQLSGKVLRINYLDLSFIGWIVVLLIVVSFVSGGYPALFLSSVKPVYALKNILRSGNKGSLLRKILVIVQFSLSIILIAGTTIVYDQLNYIRNKKLGFEKENVLFIKAKGEFQQSYSAIKNELLKQSSIINVTAEDRLLINNTSTTNNLYWEGKDNKTDVHIEYSYVDYNYFDMLNIVIKEGREFSKDMNTDEKAFILNEEAVRQMKLRQPLGQSLRLNNIEGNIIGVIKNANFKSLHNKVTPNVYIVLKDYSNLSFVYNGIILIKIAAGKTQEAISAIENIWKNVNPNIPFEYHFLDDTIDKQYVKENQTAKIFTYFSFIAVLISCMGLYGLSLFIIGNRTKEIGVRKVLGASVSSILKLLYNNFLKSLLMANIIAIPVVLYVMNKWLQDFAYRIDITWWMFALAGGIALVIALATISFQAIKAATANPVESLRYE
jgi:ABC-type antimicrobial peptide transport system permease subunit